MTTTTKTSSAFIVIRYRDLVQPGAGRPAEYIDEEETIPVAYRTKAAAESAMRAMVPPGVDPLAYAGLRVERHWITGREYVRD